VDIRLCIRCLGIKNGMILGCTSALGGGGLLGLSGGQKSGEWVLSFVLVVVSFVHRCLNKAVMRDSVGCGDGSDFWNINSSSEDSCMGGMDFKGMVVSEVETNDVSVWVTELVERDRNVVMDGFGECGGGACFAGMMVPVAGNLFMKLSTFLLFLCGPALEEGEWEVERLEDLLGISGMHTCMLGLAS
jgi:hypothetical protein